jgi:hypothetical protein
MLRYPQRLGISRSWKTLTSWIAESFEVRRLLHRQHQKEEQWEWAPAIGEVRQQQMAMEDLEMETTMGIVSKMGAATHLMVAIATVSHHHRKRSVDAHGNDTVMIDQIQDYHLGHPQQIIQPMMDQGNAQMATGLVPVISTAIGHLQEAGLAHHLWTRIFLATDRTAGDETIDLQGTTDLRESEMTGLRETIDFQEREMTALEDATTAMSVVMRTGIGSGTGTGLTTMSAAEADELEVAVAVQSVIASETESGRENH